MATSVPTFYGPTTKNERHSRSFVYLFIAALNGGLFCLGWKFTYPSQTELIFWRTASLILTVIPFVVGPIDFVLTNIWPQGRSGRSFFHALDLILIMLIWVYVIARLSLYVLALGLLREQPPSAFVGVDWTKYFPHLE